MHILQKKLLLLGIVSALCGILILITAAQRRWCTKNAENPDAGTHEKPIDSKISPEKTASVIQCVSDEMDSKAQEYTDVSND